MYLISQLQQGNKIENEVETGFAHETCTRLSKFQNMTKMVSVKVAITVNFPKSSYLFYAYSFTIKWNFLYV